MLGTSHYLSPGGGGVEGFWGITRFLGEQKGGSVVTENQRHGGGSRKLSKAIREDYFSEVTFKGGSVQFHLV